MTMDVLQFEREKLEVLQSIDIALTDNSIEIKELSDRISVKIIYAETDFGVTVFLSSPLDFIINTPELLPSKYLVSKNCDIETVMNLTSLLSWLTSELKNYNRDHHQEFNDIISNLIDNNAIEKNNYELLVEDDKTSLYVKFSIEIMEAASFMESIENNMLINSTEHYFIIKVVEMKKSLDFSLTFSSSLLRMFPGLRTLPIELDDRDITSVVLKVKDTVSEKILELQRDWMKRASFLVPLYQQFTGQREMVTFINFETMTRLQLGFVTNSKKSVVEIQLPQDYPDQHPKVTLSIMNKTPASRVKKYDINSDFDTVVFEDVNLFHKELFNILKKYTHQ